MSQPVAFARHAHLLHLTAMLKAAHAARLMRNGKTAQAASKIAGYGSVRTMRKAIAHYAKSPAPTGIGNGADLNHQ
jgi:hypothetical protein